MKTTSEIKEKKAHYRMMMSSEDPEVRKLGWDRLFRLIRPKLSNNIEKKTRLPEDAEEVLQETYLRMYKIFGEGKQYANYAEAVSHKIANNLIIDEFRKQKWSRFSLDEDDVSPFHKIETSPDDYRLNPMQKIQANARLIEKKLQQNGIKKK